MLGLAVLVAAGLGVLPRVFHLRDPIGLATLLLGAIGFWIAYTSIPPMIRLADLRVRTRRQWSEAARAAFQRASLPRRIYYLFAAVAECDGPITQDEREVMRQFLLQRFDDPVHADEIRHWEMQPLRVEDRVGLAARIAAGLDDSELDTVFCWCALVTFADGRFHDAEHRALQDVARGLGIPGARARMLFHLARTTHLSGRREPGSGRTHHDDARPSVARSRADALAVLGLPSDASPEQIRRRHRELVRKFHPDAQPHLGAAAQREANSRFQAIQRAYETLTAHT